MIDPQKEQLIPLRLVPRLRLLPVKPGHRHRLNLSTVYRWSTRGVRGRVLETLQVGGTRCTSVEALTRFFGGLTAGAHSAIPRTPSRCDRELRRANESLRAAGI